MPTYSKIRNTLQLEIERPEMTGLAHLTHYMQNHTNGVSQYFRKHAINYFNTIAAQLKLDKTINDFLPIKWDVPFPPPENPRFKFVDLFAGVGGFRLAFQNLGGKCVFTSEYNKYAQQTYQANFGKVPFGDITKIDEKKIPDHDVLLAGFPCQPFSLSGVVKKNSLGRPHGFLDKTQGTLFFDVARIIKEKKPKAFLLENVKNLVSHDKGNTFKVIKTTLEELGYSLHYQVIDGKHFVPQHRERILIVGFNKKHFKGKEEFAFPKMPKLKKTIGDILEKNVEPKYTLSDKLWNYLQNYAKKHQAAGNGFGFGIVDLDGTTRTLSARYYKDGSEILIPQAGKNPRRLTPRECARLQGFPDKFVIPVSDNQSYRQFGNSVVMPLMQAVGTEIVKQFVVINGKSRAKSHSVHTAV